MEQIIIGVLIVLLTCSTIITFYYHKLTKGVLLFNTSLAKDLSTAQKERNDYAIKYYMMIGKRNRLYNILKDARLSLVIEEQTCKQLQKANEQIYGDRYHAGYKIGYAHAIDRLNKNDLSAIALGKNGFVKNDK